MKNRFYPIFMSFFIFLLSIPGFLSAEPVEIEALAEIQAATITINDKSAIDFGKIISNGETVITIDASGGAQDTASATNGASVTEAKSGFIDVVTNIDANVTVDYPITVEIKNSLDDTEKMEITEIEANSTSSPLAFTTEGPNEIHVGGKLTVPDSQESGDYSGTATITIAYQ